MSIPFIGFGNDTLDRQPFVSKGERIRCPQCGELHPIESGRDEAGKETTLLMFYKCGEKSYLAAVAGKLVAGLRADVSGDI